MRYLGLDLGTRSLGVSISDRSGMLASFYKNISYGGNYEELIKVLNEIVETNNIDCFVLGFPKNMNNSIGERGEETLKFKNILEDIFNKPVILQDERLTTKLAESVLIQADMSRKKRKSVIDGVSAVLILQSYLDRKDK